MVNFLDLVSGPGHLQCVSGSFISKQHSSSTIKVYAAAFAAFHAPIAGRLVGRDSAVTQFLRGARRMNPPRPRTVPPWDLPTVLRALEGPPFEPLQSSSLRVLSFKTTLLLALASVKRVGDLQALSVNPVCLEFGPNDSKVVLTPRLSYVPKVLSTPFRAQVITLSAFFPPTGSQESLLCPVRALRIHIEHSASYSQKSEQLFLASVTALKMALLRSREFRRWLWRFSTAWYGTVRHGSVRYGTAQFGSVCISTAV